MDPALKRSLYSSPFNRMKLWGAWPLDESTSKIWKNFSRVFTYASASIVIFFIYMGMMDFLDSLNDFRKLSWNLCVNLVAILTLIKTVRLFRKNREINALRKKVHRPLANVKTLREMIIYEENRKAFRKSMKKFYYALFLFFPIWAVDSMYRYARHDEIPLPFKPPVYIEKDDAVAKAFLYIVYMIVASIFLFHALTVDIAMFSLLFQIYREYEFLLVEIENLDAYNRIESDAFDDDHKEMNLIEKILKKRETKIGLGKIVSRQKEIIELTEEFERNFNGSMLMQIVIGGFVIVMNFVQVLTLSLEFDLKLTPQGAYVAVMTLDLLIHCLLGNKISDRCKEVGDAIYNMPWYAMDTDLRKDFIIILIRSQKPPRITAGKIIEFNVQFYSEMMKNIYQWIALFRQIGFS